MFTKKTDRNDRRVDERPCSDIARCNAVGGAIVAAPSALELVPCGPVGLVDVAALRASSGSVFRVHQHYGHAGELRFIGDKLPELVERPRGLAAAMCPTNRCPLADARQIFEGNRAGGVLGLSHNLLGDAMVSIAPESLLVLPEAVEMPLGARRVGALERSAEFGGLAAHLLDARAGVRDAIGINGEVDDAEVYAENALDLDRLGIGNVHDRAEKEHVIEQHEVGLATNAVVKFGFEIIVEGHVDERSAIECENGNSVQRLPTEYALVIDHRAVRFEVRLNGLVELVGFASLGDCADGHLCGEPELFAQITIDEWVHPELAGAFQLERFGGCIVASEVELLHSAEQGSVLLIGCAEFDFERQIHGVMDMGALYTYSFLSPIPPTAKACGFPWRLGKVGEK